MFEKWISESAAKAAILFIFSAALFGFFLFWQGAEHFNAATEAEAKLEAANEAQAMDKEKFESELALINHQLLEAQMEKQALENIQVDLLENFTLEYSGEYFATAYCTERYPHICGGNGVTASGTVPTPGVTCAADWKVFPPGTWLYIEDVGIRRVEDSGSAIKGKRLDIAIDTHANALRWNGIGSHKVWVLSMGDA